MDSFIPYRTTSLRHELPWFNQSLKRLVKAKQRSYNKAKKSGHSTDWSKFHAVRNVFEYLTEAVANSAKRFWSYIKQVRLEVGVADLVADWLNISDGQSKVEVLNKLFTAVFTEENLYNLPKLVNNSTSDISGLQI